MWCVTCDKRRDVVIGPLHLKHFKIHAQALGNRRCVL